MRNRAITSTYLVTRTVFIVNILFFICKSSYDVKDIDVTKHVVAMVVTPSKASKSCVSNQFHFQRSNLNFCNKKVLQKVSNKHNIQHNEISKSYYSLEESEEYITHLLRFRL